MTRMWRPAAVCPIARVFATRPVFAGPTKDVLDLFLGHVVGEDVRLAGRWIEIVADLHVLREVSSLGRGQVSNPANGSEPQLRARPA